MDATTQPVPAPAESPMTETPKPFSLRDYRKSTETPKPEPKVDTAKVEAKPEPDPDVEADPELAKAVDEIEAPAQDETPQQKAARTKRHKEAAIKRRVTMLAKARDAERQAREAAEKELEDWRSGRRSGAPAQAPAPPATTESAPASATRPEPTLKDFPLEKFKDDDDPYASQHAALARALAKWDREQEAHAARESRQREQAEAQATTHREALSKSVTEARGRYADYDAVVAAASFPQTPAADYVRTSIEADPSLYGDLVHHLVTHPERMTALLQARSPREVDLLLGVEVAAVKTALEAKKAPAPPKVTATPEPTQPVSSGAATGAVLRNPLQDTGTRVSIREIRSYQQAQRR